MSGLQKPTQSASFKTATWCSVAATKAHTLALGLLAIIIVGGLAVLPGWWVKSVIQRHSVHRDDFPGSGGELARHLLDEMKLNDVGVEQTDMGDHYDPRAKVVRLTPANFSGRSLSAVVIAAHEVGHAMQDATDYPPLRRRTKLAEQAGKAQALGVVVMLAAPVVLALVKAPSVLIVQILLGVGIFSFSVLMHAVTLPVEYDASFRRALPVLKAGNFVRDEDMPAARKILKAAALTYVAAAAMSLLNIAQWFRILRF